MRHRPCNAADRRVVDGVMRFTDPTTGILAGRASEVIGDDALLASFCADLRDSFGGESVCRSPLPRWRKRESMLQSLLTSTAAKIAASSAAVLLGFGGIAAAGALPAPVQHGVASVADHVGLGFVPDSHNSNTPKTESSTSTEVTDTPSTDASNPTDAGEPPTPHSVDTPRITVPSNADTHAGGDINHGQDGEQHGTNTTSADTSNQSGDQNQQDSGSDQSGEQNQSGDQNQTPESGTSSQPGDQNQQSDSGSSATGTPTTVSNG